MADRNAERIKRVMDEWSRNRGETRSSLEATLRELPELVGWVVLPAYERSDEPTLFGIYEGGVLRVERIIDGYETTFGVVVKSASSTTTFSDEDYPDARLTSREQRWKFTVDAKTYAVSLRGGGEGWGHPDQASGCLQLAQQARPTMAISA